MKKQLNNINRLYNSREAAQILGVNVSTVKRWTDLGALKCLQSRGGHRKFTLQHIRSYLDLHPDSLNDSARAFLSIAAGNSLSSVDPATATPDERLEILYDLLIGNREDRIYNTLMYLYLRDNDLPKLFSENIMPLLRRMGEDWHKGILGVTQEHVSSSLLRRILLRFSDNVNAADSTGIATLTMSLSGDRHDMSLLMLDILLRRHGLVNYFSGAATPTEGLKEFLEGRNVRRIYISLTYNEDRSASARELRDLLLIADDLDLSVIVGGRELEVAENIVSPRLKILESFRDVEADIHEFIDGEKK